MGSAGTSAAAAIATMIVAHYNRVAETPGCAPIFMREDDGTVLAQDWAAGFYGAMKLRLSAWEPLLSSGYDAMGPLMPIFVNCTGADGVPLFGLLPAAIDKAWVDEAWSHIPEAVVTLYKYWAPQRKAQVRAGRRLSHTLIIGVIHCAAPRPQNLRRRSSRARVSKGR
jgi:uncharacterized protein